MAEFWRKSFFLKVDFPGWPLQSFRGRFCRHWLENDYLPSSKRCHVICLQGGHQQPCNTWQLGKVGGNCWPQVQTLHPVSLHPRPPILQTKADSPIDITRSFITCSKLSLPPGWKAWPSTPTSRAGKWEEVPSLRKLSWLPKGRILWSWTRGRHRPKSTWWNSPSPSILLRGLREPEREKVSAMLPLPPTSVSRASSATSILSRLAPEDTSARETEEPSPTSARSLARGRWRKCWATAQSKLSWGARQSTTPGTAQTGAEGKLCNSHTSDSSSVTPIIFKPTTYN